MTTKDIEDYVIITLIVLGCCFFVAFLIAAATGQGNFNTSGGSNDPSTLLFLPDGNGGLIPIWIP